MSKIAIVTTLAAAGVALFAACVDGTTPDCTKPEAKCAPDLDGAVTPSGDGASDVASDVAREAAGDTGIDAATDGPNDGALDGDARG